MEYSADLEAMERMGITGALLSVPASVDASGVRKMNEFLTELTQFRPKAYGMLACLCPKEVESTLKEVNYSFDTLKADGFILLSSYEGKYIDDDIFDPLLAELNSRNAVVLLHPTFPPNGIKQFITDPSIYDFPLETTKAVADLLFKKKFSTYPNIRWIISHAGGAIPFLSYRLGIASEWNDMALRKQDVDAGLASLFYDLALSVSDISINALLTMAGSKQILFGTDYPLRFENGVSNSLAAFNSTKLLGSEERFDIGLANARSLFKRFQ